MAFYKDLSPFEYLGGDETVNVGWLDKSDAFTTGDVSSVFDKKLLALCKSLCKRPIRLTRGFHSCPFCNREDITHGNGEIRVRGIGNRVYAAPVLIYHYVTANKYLPPSEFISAVERLDDLRVN